MIIGKFCQIASGVEVVMNGANHQMNAVTTFPFYTLEGGSKFHLHKMTYLLKEIQLLEMMYG